MIVKVSLDKAKVWAHEQRRARRAAEFAPFDEVIMVQIPGKDAQAAEAARQPIRDKYAAMQERIESAITLDGVKAALES